MKKVIVILLILIIAILGFAGCSKEETKTPERWCVEEAIWQNEFRYLDETVMAYYAEEVALYDNELLELAKEYEYGYCICRVTLITADNVKDAIYEHNYIVFITYEQDLFDRATGQQRIKEYQIIDCDAEEIKVGE
jgi:hypothetical protein